MEQLILDVFSKPVEKKEVIRSIQHGFAKRKSCLTNMVAFYVVITVWAGERRAVDTFHKAFGTVSHNILVGMLRRYVIHEWMVR